MDGLEWVGGRAFRDGRPAAFRVSSDARGVADSRKLSKGDGFVRCRSNEAPAHSQENDGRKCEFAHPMRHAIISRIVNRGLWSRVSGNSRNLGASGQFEVGISSRGVGIGPYSVA